MTQRRRFIAACIGIILAASSLMATAQTHVSSEIKKGYAPVNGVKLYYEIHGSGEPLILLHGGVGGLDMFGPTLPALAKSRKVIAVELQGHGRTADPHSSYVSCEEWGFQVTGGQHCSGLPGFCERGWGQGSSERS